MSLSVRKSLLCTIVACSAALVLLLMLAGDAFAAADYTNFGVPVPVADGTGAMPGPYTVGTGSPYPTTIHVSNLAGVVSHLKVLVQGVDHQNIDDLNLLLVSPAGRGIQLMSDVGGNAAFAGGIWFDDDSPDAIPDDGPILNQHAYKPTNDFGGLGEDSYFATTGNTGDVYPAPAPAASAWAGNTTLAQAFNGTDPNGDWSLYATDDKPGGTGGIDATGAYVALEISTVPGGTGGIAPQAHFSVAKSAANKYTTVFDASSSLASGGVASSFNWDFNSDGRSDVSCPGPDPVLATKFDKSGSVNATLNVVSSAGSSSTRVTTPVTGISTNRHARTAASTKTALGRQAYLCQPVSGQTPPGDITGGGGPPTDCSQTLAFDIVEAIGCFTVAQSFDAIPSKERQVISRVATGYSGTSQNIRISGSRSVSPSTLVSQQQRLIAYSTQPVRLNGLDFYPSPGAAIVLVAPVTQGFVNSESMPGYIASSKATVKLGDITLTTGEVRLPLGYAAAKTAKVHLGDFQLPGIPLIGELPIKGKVGVDLAYKRAEVNVNAALPNIFKSDSGDLVTGAALLTATNADGLLLDQLHLHVPSASVGGVGLDNLDFKYERLTSSWDASGTVSFPPGASLSAEVLVQHGALKYVYVHAVPPDPGIQSAPGVFITYLDFTYDGRSGTGFGGGIGVAAGPKVATPYGQCSLVGVNGSFLLTIGDPVSYRADGDVSLLCIHLVHGYYLANSNGYFEVGGDADFKIADDVEFSAALKVAAQFTLAHAQIDADLDACVHFWIGGGCVGAEAVVSDKGFGICADLGFTHAGGGVVFPTKVLLFADSCDISRFRSLDKNAGASAAGGGRTFSWGAGKPSGLVAVTGVGGPPGFTLSGPHGRTIHALATEKAADHVTVARDLDSTTYLFVRKPSAGTWTITPDPGTTITGENVADGLPAPKATAKVSGHGAKRKLRYRVSAAPGERVSFALVGKHAAAQIGTAKGASGTLAFTVPPAASGKLSVVAAFARDGLPRERVTAATFTVRAARLRAPRRLKLSRHGSKLKLSWPKVAGAAGYIVTTRLSDGQRAQYRTKRLALSLSGLAPSAKGTISVRARPKYGRAGAARSARLARVKPPRIRP